MSAFNWMLALEAASKQSYIEGYVNGASHPKGERVMAKAKELADLWWGTIDHRLEAAARPTPEEGTK